MYFALRNHHCATKTSLDLFVSIRMWQEALRHHCDSFLCKLRKSELVVRHNVNLICEMRCQRQIKITNGEYPQQSPSAFAEYLPKYIFQVSVQTGFSPNRHCCPWLRVKASIEEKCWFLSPRISIQSSPKHITKAKMSLVTLQWSAELITLQQESTYLGKVDQLFIRKRMTWARAPRTPGKPKMKWTPEVSWILRAGLKHHWKKKRFKWYTETQVDNHILSTTV